jgi:hypothetical protein
MYTSVDFTSQIVGRRGVPCPTNKGVSYTNVSIWCGLSLYKASDLKNRHIIIIMYWWMVTQVEEEED